MAAEIDGEFVVFLIGMRINKPWKLHKWVPIFLAMPRMLRELSRHPELGLLGYQLFPGIADRKSQLALTLSGGERQSVAIARGLMAENVKLLMIDEPSAGLAPLLIDEVYGKIAEIRKTGVGVLVVEQSPKRIADCDRIYLIENGEVRMEGRAKEVLESKEVMQAYLGG